MTVLDLSELTWQETVGCAGEAIAILPIASQEQHAGHLPLGTDSYLAEAVVDGALGRFTDDGGPTLVRLPLMPYGHSPHHLFRAAVSLTADTMLHVLADCLDSLVGCGFERILLVNGHGGNTELLSLAVKAVTLRHRVVAATCDYWALIAGSAAAETGLDPTTVPGHAGVFETSLLSAARPALVRAPSPYRDPGEPPLFDRPVHAGLTIAANGEWERVGGLTDDPAAADVALGSTLLQRCVDGLVDTIRAFDHATAHRGNEA